MARTIDEIYTRIAAGLRESVPGLSDSKVAEWRLLAWTAAAAVHSFELLLDLFRSEVEERTARLTAGTKPWYAEMCRRFQNGHTLEYDPATATFYYARQDPEAQIIKVVAVSEGDRSLSVKVARQDADGRIVPLEGVEKQNFMDYIKAVSAAGIQARVVSATADTVRYRLRVYYDPSYPVESVRAAVLAALEEFKTSLGFDARFYPQRLLNAVTDVGGVVTVQAVGIEHKDSSQDTYAPAGAVVELGAGYFEYAADSELEFTSK